MKRFNLPILVAGICKGLKGYCRNKEERRIYSSVRERERKNEKGKLKIFSQTIEREMRMSSGDAQRMTKCYASRSALPCDRGGSG